MEAGDLLIQLFSLLLHLPPSAVKCLHSTLDILLHDVMDHYLKSLVNIYLWFLNVYRSNIFWKTCNVSFLAD